MGIPPAQIDCDQSDARLNKPAGQQQSLAPGRDATAIGRRRAKFRDETVSFAQDARFGVQIERFTRFFAGDQVPGFLVESICRFQLAAVVGFAPQGIEPIHEGSPIVEPLERDSGRQRKVRHLEWLVIDWIGDGFERIV